MELRRRKSTFASKVNTNGRRSFGENSTTSTCGSPTSTSVDGLVIKNHQLGCGRRITTEQCGVAAFLRHAIDEFHYEDAIVGDEPYLNHSLLSPYLNIGCCTAEVIAAVKELGDDIALNSIEGFIRQIIGWREYVHGLYGGLARLHQ